MELIEGFPLSDIIKSLEEKGERFEEERIWRIFTQVQSTSLSLSLSHTHTHTHTHTHIHTHTLSLSLSLFLFCSLPHS